MPTTPDVLLDLARPDAVVVPAPSGGPGNWAGAASVWSEAGTVVLAYRVRRPLDEGRGVHTVVARSADGVDFAEVARLHRDAFGAESFERPAIVRREDGGWRLYVSCATPGSKHWWIEAVDADTLEGLSDGARTRVMPGDHALAVKDPVVLRDADGWHAWVCEHPLDESGQEDRMSTAYYASADGLRWQRQRTVLAPRAGAWDARGARVTAIVRREPLTVLYDGRARAEDNWHEVTGLARAVTGEHGLGSLLAADEGVAVQRSPQSDGALRYAAISPDGEGSSSAAPIYLERAREDGAHDLVVRLPEAR